MLWSKYVDNKFTNAASSYILSAVLFIIFPILFIIKIICNILKCLRKDTNMKGKVVLITGASSGIGEYMAYEYARKGASLAIVARREERLRKVAERATELGSPDVLVLCADVSNFNECRRFVDETINHFDRLDHLVNNAGIGSMYSVNEDIDITKFAPVMDINFWGSVYPTYFAIPHLKKSKGNIVVNGSASAFVQTPKTAFYSVKMNEYFSVTHTHTHTSTCLDSYLLNIQASKAALIGFYGSLRHELSPEITITIVTLGYIESELTQGKTMSLDGLMQYHQQIKDVIYEMFPVMSTAPCAKAIVNGACRGDRHITEPKYISFIVLFNFFFPELVEWWNRTFFLPKL